MKRGEQISPEKWIECHPEALGVLEALRALTAIHNAGVAESGACAFDTPRPAEDTHGKIGSPVLPNAPKIPGYEILSLIGRGGKGVVWKARRIELDRIEAVKLILCGLLADQKDLDRFLREVKQTAKLQHPNIVRVYDAGTVDGQPYFSMEYVQGTTLGQLTHDRLARNEPLTAHEAAQHVKTIALAVQCVHDLQIVHRDLKPSNVLVDLQGVSAKRATRALCQCPRFGR